jgi:hypothetical protein
MNRATFFVLTPLLLSLPGCPPMVDTPKDNRPLVGSGMDMFMPTELRIHPLTRIAVDSGGKKSLEVRIELADQFADVTKGVGDFTFTVSRAGTLTSTVVDHWTTSISTPAENKKAWDPITRTYLFRREIPDAWGADAELKNLIVGATLALPNGHTVSGEFHMK